MCVARGISAQAPASHQLRSCPIRSNTQCRCSLAPWTVFSICDPHDTVS